MARRLAWLRMHQVVPRALAPAPPHGLVLLQIGHVHFLEVKDRLRLLGWMYHFRTLMRPLDRLLHDHAATGCNCLLIKS